MKLPVTFILTLITYSLGFSNAAAPGFWNAGGIGRCTLLYPEDSLLYQEIQMINEIISIDLYKGFAVVKGEYWMYNHSNNEIKVKVGYPVNTDYDKWIKNGRRINILLRSLYNLEVYSNAINQKIISKPLEIHEEAWPDNNWFVWENSFTPKDTTLIEVYFIVNTNETIVSEGYDRDQINGLIYILESGASWKQPINRGEIRIRLMDNLNLDDVRGISPDSIFEFNNKILVTRFVDLSPTPDNNIILAYADKTEDWNIEHILKNHVDLYRSIDDFSHIKLSEIAFKRYKFGSPFDVHSWGGGAMVGIVMLFYFLGIPLFFVAGFIILIIVIVRKNKKRKNVS